MPRDTASATMASSGPDPVWRTSTMGGVAPERMSTMETMGRKKRPRRSFTPAFKAEVVELVRQPGQTAVSVARDLDLTETAVRQWVRQTDVDASDGAGGDWTSAERAELARLRAENRVLREERDILKRATAFFARETR